MGTYNNLCTKERAEPSQAKKVNSAWQAQHPPCVIDDAK
jgi:hypothetical protein